MAKVEHDDMTRTQTAGMIIVIFALVFASMEMVPGWGIVNPGWPEWYFYLIVAAAGLVGGPLMAHPGYRLAGLIAGPVGTVCSLFALALYLANANWANKLILGGVMMLGAVPGIVLYFALRKFLPGPAPAPADDEAEEDRPARVERKRAEEL